MTKTRYRSLLWVGGLVLAALAWPALGTNTSLDQKSILYPEQRHENNGENVTQIVEKQHYNSNAVDDDLSYRVLDLYIESLESNPLYML